MFEKRFLCMQLLPVHVAVQSGEKDIDHQLTDFDGTNPPPPPPPHHRVEVVINATFRDISFPIPHHAHRDTKHVVKTRLNLSSGK